MHSKKNLGFSILDFEHYSMYGSYKIMQDHLYIFPRKFLDFQHMILKLYYCLDLTRLCKISCASFQEKSWHILETLLLCGSYKIMQDLLCIFPRKILEFQCIFLKLYCCVDRTR